MTRRDFLSYTVVAKSSREISPPVTYELKRVAYYDFSAATKMFMYQVYVPMK